MLGCEMAFDFRSEGTEVVETHDDLVNRVLETHKMIFRSQAISPVWLEVDLTMAQLKTLMVLGCEGRPTIGQVADALHISLPTASHLVDRLVHAGLAERAEDPADRRRMLTCLTPQGEDLAARLHEGSRDQFRLWLSQLSHEDLAALLQGLQALAEVSRATECEVRCERSGS